MHTQDFASSHDAADRCITTSRLLVSKASQRIPDVANEWKASQLLHQKFLIEVRSYVSHLKENIALHVKPDVTCTDVALMPFISIVY